MTTEGKSQLSIHEAADFLEKHWVDVRGRAERGWFDVDKIFTTPSLLSISNLLWETRRVDISGGSYMACIEEVIAALVKNTHSRGMDWIPYEWKEGVITCWMTEWHDCAFDVESSGDQPRLTVRTPEFGGGVVIGEGEPIKTILDVLKKEHNSANVSTGEALIFALDRLKNFSHP